VLYWGRCLLSNMEDVRRASSATRYGMQHTVGKAIFNRRNKNVYLHFELNSNGDVNAL
jgi:hypothetical protein